MYALGIVLSVLAIILAVADIVIKETRHKREEENKCPPP